ncbi:hypothetical protein JOC77_000742 [Peribacillus deserti]|uniref:Transposase IS4-like domain-containing protein n=1 Tax=Peribacillus deserti TaxID=673318 RepID=A0ABS2QDU0_9BACI|nr:hypothetical protein [Peribacillus deserti]
MFEPLLEKVIENSGKPSAVAADAGYKTPAIAQYLLENEIRPALPYTRPRTKDGYLKKHDFVYDEHYDCYLCPQGQVLKYSTTTRKAIVNTSLIHYSVTIAPSFLNVPKVKNIRS